MRIYLIGLPGVGKSTLGKELAERLNYKFYDLDIYIEHQAMMFIDDIFKAYGEEYFRALESNCLKEISIMDNIVIACGGGIIKDINNKKLMDNGLCIYLSAPLDEITNRLDSSPIERPLLHVKTLEDLYIERKMMYDIFKDIEIENTDLNKAIDMILHHIGDNYE